MNSDYQLLIDTWEGQAEIDEAVLKANDVAGIIVRLNNMNGGHHMDLNFQNQWDQAKAFVRAPYFVYNPWADGAANYVWLASHMPSDAKAVLLDVEVMKFDYAEATYATELQKFYNMVRAKWTTAIYTSEGYLPMLSSWPAGAEFWWAEYPREFYTGGIFNLTWTELRVMLQKYDKPLNASKIPGPLRMWQFSGDCLVLPGNSRIMDANVFYGSRAQLEAWLGAPSVVSNPNPIPIPGGTMYIKGTTKAANSAGGLQIRETPNIGAKSLGSLPFGTAVEGYLENGWIHGTFNGIFGYLSASWVNYVVTDPPAPVPVELPVSVDITLDYKDKAGNVLKTYKGTAT